MLSVAVIATSGAVFANRNDVAQTVDPKAESITEKSDGSQRNNRSALTTVRLALNADACEGSAVKTIKYRQPIPFKVERKVNPQLRPGMMSVIQNGKEGLAEKTYRITYENGKETSRELVKETIIRPAQNRIIEIGRENPSRGVVSSLSKRLKVVRTLTMHASAYDPGPRSCGRYATGRTATGIRAGRGVVAVDPRVIKLGSRLYIEGYGHAIAGDTGSAIKGHKIDLGFNSYSEAIRFGRKRVTVHILK